MKKKLLLLLLLAIPFCANAQKRLASLTCEKKYSTERGEFTYDEQGRVSRVAVTRSNGRVYYCDYTYSDSQINCRYSDDEKTVVYSLEDGKVKTMSITWPDEELVIEDEFIYDGSTIVGMNLFDTENGERELNERNTITWDGDNISEFYHVSAEGTSKESWKKFTYTASSLSSTPFVNGLFAYSFSTAPDYGDWIYMIGLCMDSSLAPKNLFATMCHDSDEKPQGLYTFQYETNSDGDIIKISIVHDKDGSSNNYTLEWEGTAQEGSQDKDLTGEGNKTVKYNEGFTDNTNLNGNVIDNIYYNISPNNGGYDAFEGYIYINKPTADNDVDGKDIFGEDFRNGFTGIAFRVSAGSGKIKINAETTGSMMLKVRVGHNEPYEMMLSGKTMATFPYNVSEDTFVFIYGSLFTGARGVSQSPASNALKIYGLSWESGTDGIETLQTSDVQNAPFYNLNGQRISSPQKGRVYIRNHKKVLY